MEALAIPQELDGQSIADSSLRLVFEKKKIPKKNRCFAEDRYPNKGNGQKAVAFCCVLGNPYISLQRKKPN